jgi:hypothetical protein
MTNVIFYCLTTCQITCAPTAPADGLHKVTRFVAPQSCSAPSGRQNSALVEGPVEGYGGSTAYAGNVKKAARRETCAETFYDTF